MNSNNFRLLDKKSRLFCGPVRRPTVENHWAKELGQMPKLKLCFITVKGEVSTQLLLFLKSKDIAVRFEIVDAKM